MLQMKKLDIEMTGSVAKNILATSHSSEQSDDATTSCMTSEFLQQILFTYTALPKEHGSPEIRGCATRRLNVTLQKLT
jgi:hypothetical protein